MEIMIKATDQITELDGVPCRVWEGTTVGGVKCHVFVHRLAVHNDADSSEFDAALKAMPAPRYVTLDRVLR